MKWQIVLIVVCIIRVSFSQHIYHALSSDRPVTQCPVDTCYNLTELLNGDIPGGRASSVTLLLLPGVHMITRSENTVFNVTSSTNLAIKGDNSTQRATIKCNGSIGFEFNSCVNLTIRYITIEDCGASKHLYYRYLPNTKFSVYISHSLGVYIIDTNILNGTGIGLLLENVQYELLISDSIFSYHKINLYIVSYDNSQVKSIHGTIQIFNSSFNDARAIGGRYYYSGVAIRLFQTKFYTEVEIKNVHIGNTKSKNMRFELNTCTNVIKIYNLYSISTDKEQNLYLSLFDSTKCVDIQQQTNVIVDNTNFNGGEVIIKGREHLATIFFNNTNISQCTLTITKLKLVLFINIAIQKSESQRWMPIQMCALHIIGYFLYQQNQGSLLLEKSNITVETYSNIVFRDNSNSHESPLYTIESNLKMKSATSLIFENNIGYQSGGITLVKSVVTVENNAHFMFLNNTGKRGGAMAFYNQSKLILARYSNLTFIYNHATIAGGAIYVQDYDYVNRFAYSDARFHKFLEILSTHYPNIIFTNNTAIQAGSALYGGTGNKNSLSFDNSKKNNLSVGATNPFKVCVCDDSIPNCNIRSLDFYIIPGQPFKIDLVAVGQWDGVVPANIQIDISEPSQAKVEASEYIQSTGRYCTKLHYTFTHLKEQNSFNLEVITIDRDQVAQYGLHINIFTLNCSLGFSFNNEGRICVCNEVFADHGIECDIETLTIRRPNSKWINATFDHLLPLDQSGVLVHNHCPYDYCLLSINDTVQQLNLNYPDQQCAFHRSGILCGGCEVNFSQVLGTSECKVCTNSRLPLLLFLIALAGVALVMCLMFLNVIVSVGAVNGLIFYANILRVNNTFFFPQLASTSFLSTFIAWLNLDLGIETCLYNGLDAYFKTWLQFVFPSYIWLLVAVIIVIAHYSTKASKLVGRNPVQVLATLFLLSYAKLLRTIITIFSSTELIYPDGYVRRVWLYDGNVDFLKGKHVPLFIVALIFLIIVTIPITATLTCIQWLQKISHYKLLFWIMKLQPLFDAYTGPYRIKHRYWTGLLLLARVCLFLVFSLNTLGDPIINLMTTVTCTFTLFAYLSIIGGVYKLWSVNIIETAFILNLGLLSAAGLYKVAANVAITPITYTSTGIAFILFVVTILYHPAAKMTQTKCGQALIGYANKLYHSFKERRTELYTRENNVIIANNSEVSDNTVTYSEIQLTEPLIVTN